MAHTYPPEDPRSPASTFAKDQPGRGVVADDVEEHEGYETAAEATAADVKGDSTVAAPSRGPDRAPHDDPLHTVIRDMEDDDEEAAKQSDDVPRQPERVERPGTKRASAPVEEAESKTEGSSAKSTSKSSSKSGGSKS